MKNLKRCSILKEGNTHYSDSSKPLDKLFDDMDNAKDKFFKDMDKALPREVTYVSRLESEVKQLKDIVKGYRFEITGLEKEITDLKERIKDDDDLYEIYQDSQRENTALKKSLSEAVELIEELKKENKLCKAQLRKFGKVFDRFDKTKEINQEIDIERGQEVKTNQKGE